MKLPSLSTLIPLALLFGACATEDDGSDDVAVTEEAHEVAGAQKHVVLPNGVDISYYEQGRSDGEAVIFLHGYTDSNKVFSLNYPGIPSRYHVYGITFRGHGDSSKPADGYHSKDFANDVIAFMNKKNISKAHFVGSSLGSFVGQRIAAKYPDRVRRLVLISSSPRNGDSEAVQGAKEFIDTWTEVDPEFVAYFVSTSYLTAPQAFIDQSTTETLKVPLHVWQKAIAGLVEDDGFPFLKNIKAKTLIIHGDLDDVFSNEQQTVLKNSISKSVLHTYPNAGHGVFADLPNRTNCDIVNFLDCNDGNDRCANITN